MSRQACNRNCISSYILFITSLQLFFKLVANQSYNVFQPKCNEIAGVSQCDCYIGYNELEWTCGRENIDSFAFIIHRPELTVDCFGNDPNNFVLLPKMERIVTAAKVTIKQCSQVMSIEKITQNVKTTHVEELVLEDTKLTEPLQYNYFKSFVALERLNLHHTKLTKLENNSFANLENLTHLQISNNVIEHLPNDVFVALKNLQYLDLSFNHLQDLQPGIFRNQKKLFILKLNNNNISTISKDVFQGASWISELHLDSNKLVTFTSDVFSHLKALKKIILSRNYFESLPEDLFKKNKSLKVLKLVNGNDYKLLKELPAKLLFYLAYLSEVDIQTGLTSISPDIFQKSGIIKSIRISFTHLTELPSTLFNAQTRMESLDLSFNKLKVLPDDVFRNTGRIRTLKLSHNSLQHLPGTIVHLKGLERLDVDNNNLINFDVGRFLPTEKASTFIFNFDLRNNSIRSMDFLSIYNNYRRHQTSWYARSGQIQLSHNPFHCDCNALYYIKMTTELHELKIDIDQLQCRSPESLKGRLVSQVLDMDLVYPFHTQSSSKNLCPRGCSCMVMCDLNLLKVDCSNSGFTDIPSLPRIKNEYHLRTVLHMEDNKLKELPTAKMVGYDDVYELHVANNSLTEISGNNLPKSISFLNLSLNNLQRLSPSLLEVLRENRINVSLGNNPWVCDCSAQYLSKFADKNSVLILDLKEMICTSGKHFQELTYDDLCLDRNRLIIVISILVCGLVICLGTLAVLYYKYKQEIKIWLYAHNMMLWFVREEEIDKDKKYDAFLSYSHKDEDFIVDHLLPGLEQGPTPFKICIHVRDWIIGELIPDQIVRSVAESRRTIIVLSKNFLESVWALMEFKAAHTAALSEGRARVIVIIYGDIGPIGCLDPELKTYLQSNTYAKWGEPWFWDKLRFAMPHRSNRRSTQMDTAEDVEDNYQLELYNLRT